MYGLHKDGNSFFYAKVKKRKNHFQIKRLVSSETVKQLYISNKSSLSTGLEASEILIKPLTIPASSKLKLSKLLPLQTESLHFLEKEESIYHPLLLKRTSETAELLFFTTTKPLLKNHIEAFQKCKIDPLFISHVPQALVRYVKSQFKHFSSLCILHLGMTSSTCVQMVNNLPLKSFTIPIGWQSFKKHHKDKNKKLSLNHVEEGSLLEELFSSFKASFSNILMSMYDEGAPISLFFTGQVSQISGLFPALTKALNFKFSKVANSPSEIKMPHLKEYAIPIGLALDSQSEDERFVQFRQGDFTSKKTIHSRVLNIFSLAVLSSILTFFCYQHFNSQYQHTVHQLNQRLNEAIIADHKFLGRKFTSHSKDPFEIKLKKWKKELAKEAKAFPYFNQHPRVSTILTWLSQHPFLEKNTEIKIESFFYHLDEQKNVPRLKVQFSISSPLLARRWKEELLSSHSPVDSHHDFVWEASDDVYSTAFYLKPGYKYD